LKEWKQRHEENIYYRQVGIVPESGSIIKVSITNYGPIKNSLNIELYKNNIIWGENGIGKTLICENLSSLIFKEKITNRWQHGHRQFSSIFNIVFLKERKHEIKIEITNTNILNYYYDNVIFSNIMPPYNVVYLSDIFEINFFELDNILKNIDDDREYEIKDNEYHLNELLKHLSITIDVFKSLIKYINANEKYFVYGIEFENDILKAQITPTSHLFKFQVLSGSEKQRVILELAFQLSKLYSDIGPTLFLIEQTAISIFDDKFLVYFLKLVIDEKLHFQTIITFPDLHLLKNFPHAYDDYHLIHLIFEEGNVKLDDGHCS
jgi:hypothetical protein